MKKLFLTLLIFVSLVSYSHAFNPLTVCSGVPAVISEGSYAQTCTMEGDIACETDDFDIDFSDPDWDKATTGLSLQGTECLEIDSNDKAYFFLPDATEMWVTFMIRIEDDPISTTNVISFEDSSSNILSIVYVNTTSDSYYVRASSGSFSAVLGTSFSPDTTFYLQLRVKQGSSSDAELEIWMSTDGTTWGTSKSSLNGTSYGQPTKLHLYPTPGTTTYYDLFKVSTTGFIMDATDDL